ncbi:MAG: septal ring lytic transglycosylase RlpA family protein [Candidatus Binataceae bacterium]
MAPPLPSPPPIASKAAEKPRETIARASWYGRKFTGRKTASGEKFSPREMTAASKDLPLGTRVVVTNMRNGHSVRVRINDCGPLRKGRKIDLSMRAAHKLGIIHDGVAPVKIRVVKVPRGAPMCGFI